MKRYPIKHNVLFNLDSMREHLSVLIDDYYLDNAKLPKHIEYYEKYLQEVENLLSDIMFNGNTGTWAQLERSRQISDERNILRYTICKSAGMNETDAAQAFFD